MGVVSLAPNASVTIDSRKDSQEPRRALDSGRQGPSVEPAGALSGRQRGGHALGLLGERL